MEQHSGVQGHELDPGSTVAVLVLSSDTWAGESGPNTNTPRVFMVRTQDSTPPVFINSSPTIVATFFTACHASFTLNEQSTVYFIVTAVNGAESPEPAQLDPPPSPASIRKIATQTSNSTLPSSFQTSGVGRVPAANVTETVTISGLKSLTRYAMWAVAADAHGNMMAAASQPVMFVTMDDHPPRFIEMAATEVAAHSAKIELRLDEPGQVRSFVTHLEYWSMARYCYFMMFPCHMSAVSHQWGEKHHTFSVPRAHT